MRFLGSSLIAVFSLIICFFNANAQIVCKHRRNVLAKNESWKPGRIDDEREVVDSFYYDNGLVKEVVYSLIRRRGYKIVDSIPQLSRTVWDEEGKLVMTEYFTKDGKIAKIDCQYPSGNNIIPNGSFELHDSIPPHEFYFQKDESSLLSLSRKNTCIINKTCIKTEIKDFDTLNYYLLEDSVCRKYNSGEKKIRHNYYILRYNNSIKIDSFLVRYDEYNIPRRFGSVTIHPSPCNYEGIKISVPGWTGHNKRHLFIYDYERRRPWHPLHWNGYEILEFKPKTGNSFIALRSHGSNNRVDCALFASNSYLSAKLRTTLKKGETYYMEFWYWKKDTKEENSVKVCFTEDPIVDYEGFKSIENNFRLENLNKTKTKGVWIRDSIVFTASEYARYMHFGYDISNSRFPSAIYLDDFILVKETEKELIEKCFTNGADKLKPENSVMPAPIVFNEQVVLVNKPIQLDNIFFHYNSAELIQSSEETLNELYDFLIEFPEFFIEISGHTDNKGTEKFNNELSERRADAVCYYLVGKGISRERLKSVGYGNSNPISDNTTEDGRRLNRRVEFEVIKN